MDSQHNLTPEQLEVLDFRRSLYRPTPKQTVVEWAEANVHLSRRQTEHPGPFSTSTRPYMREPMEVWRLAGANECVLCWGSQTAKTTCLMTGAAWMICEDPSPMLWILPTETLARSFSKTRWATMLEDCPPATLEFPPDRHKITHLEQHFRRCTLNFIGSNSPANLASRPVRVLIADEVDKFADGSGKEADSLSLAEQRLKAFSSSKVFLTSTPTLIEGRIWQRYLQGDQRHFYIPCPNCGKPITLQWPQVKWSPEAKAADGTWDLHAVQASARYVCQECDKPISDAQKVVALRSGEWRPTNPAAQPGVRSYHLSSLYSPDRKCTWGAIACQFLREKRSLLGLQGFINGMLAEPFEREHDFRTERVELVLETSTKAPAANTVRLMTVDCQARAPHFWFTIRDWSSTDAKTTSTLVSAKSAMHWEELRAIQAEAGVIDASVVVDSGYGAKSDAEVYRQCARFSTADPRCQRNGIPVLMGWMPAKGMPSRKMFKTEDGSALPWTIAYRDPFLGTVDGGRCLIMLLEFASEHLKDVLATLRDPRRSAAIGVEWAVAREAASEEYWRHMDAEFLSERTNGRTGRVTREWAKRSARWPNHLFDCEVMQVAAAMFCGLLPGTALE
ncbi:MAG TPA: phage terminase large subunit family protein [Verrucomicrobiota bacterium]|jgi:hypothetical protein|nr:MAG: Phage terminase large subunit (GpA) [Verrucomicrobia bacterium ADurb.Bin006]HOR72025.1 phage terminase large subunit family protein [Verrucomicrobiota bacterium]